ncbi:allantoicase [Auricularia subglabra TFB-10046 SS5]|uniref:Allantoicase n=1 Tax=Auricularia subglabra (strain TFB-10046 / SS5) TaxID=717982 RepID=J0WSX0_AURST|nr:allantoicase [Auricularia subglabra TFB-10046 SS5]
MSKEYTALKLDDFKPELSTLTELSSVALGGRIVSVSDEFFAEAENLIKVEPAPSLKGQFGPKGALFSGWESRRHNPAFDWCIIKLGARGFIEGFDVDTSWFNGNEAPEVSVEALSSTDTEPPQQDDTRWVTILPRLPLGPHSRHLLKIPATEESFNYVKLNMYPDGGIARFRVYGLVKTIFDSPTELMDLASVFSGARVVFTSDQHFGVGSNLLLPGRGKDMGDGWETKRSRRPGHRDYVIVKLGHPGYLEHVEVDTAHFKGNFPESCEMHCLLSDKTVPGPDEPWTLVLPRTKLGPHRRHLLQLDNVRGQRYSHARLTIFPDGGVKRLRLFGRLDPAGPRPSEEAPLALSQDDLSLPAAQAGEPPSVSEPAIPALWLTAEAFAPFGHVVQAWSDVHAVPKGIKTSHANQGTAVKFHRLAPVQSSYPADSAASTALAVYRAGVTPGAAPGGEFFVRLLERHPCTNQAFIPMGTGGGIGEDAIQGSPARAYLVVVALNGTDDKPDVGTMRAFVATTAQGIVYGTGIWHHPLIALESTIDFTCVETQIGNGNRLDCEIMDMEPAKTVRVQVPKL